MSLATVGSAGAGGWRNRAGGALVMGVVHLLLAAGLWVLAPREPDATAARTAPRELQVQWSQPPPQTETPMVDQMPVDLAPDGPATPVALPQLPADHRLFNPERLQLVSSSLFAGQVDAPPRELDNPPPVYPGAARRQGIEGEVKVKLRIDRDGRVRDVRVIEVAGHPAFGEAVEAAALRWRFAPARHQGRQVEVWGIKTVRFRLQQG